MTQGVSSRKPGPQPSGIRNTTLLMIAIGLAVVVVIVYMIQIRMIRTSQEKGMTQVMQFARDVRQGELIEKKDVVIKDVSRLYAQSLGTPVLREDFDVVIGHVALENGLADEIVEYRHIKPQNRSRPSNDIPKGMVAIPLEVDPRFVPGDILRVGDRVNVVAILQVGNKAPRAYRVIYELPVKAVGGRGEKVQALRTDKPTRSGFVPSSYRSITVAVPADVALELANVLTHAIGSVRLELCPSDGGIHNQREKINKELGALAKAAAVTEDRR